MSKRNDARTRLCVPTAIVLSLLLSAASLLAGCASPGPSPAVPDRFLDPVTEEVPIVTIDR